MDNGHFLLRKGLHVLFGIATLFLTLELWAGAGPIIFRWVLVASALLFLAIEYFRLELGVRFPLYLETGKAHEQRSLHGLTLGAIGTILTLSLFDFTIAIAALAMQYFGDPAAAVTGRYFGKRKLFRQKTIAGSLAMLLVSFAVGYAILESVKLAAIMAATAALTEAALDRVDDNLVVPLAVGAIGALFSVLWMVP